VKPEDERPGKITPGIIQKLRSRMRYANERAEKADAEWNRIHATHVAREPDPMKLRKDVEHDFRLSDLVALRGFWISEVARCSNMIKTELAVAEYLRRFE